MVSGGESFPATGGQRLDKKEDFVPSLIMARNFPLEEDGRIEFPPPPFKGSEKFRQEIYLFQGKEALEKSVMEAIEANRIPREKLRRKVTPMWKESTEFAGRKFFPLVPSPKISRSFELGEFRLPDCYLNSILQL